MLYVPLPNTALHPSALCLGTAEFGSGISNDDAFAILDAFAEAGGNIADTAHLYAAWLPDGWGKSERTLGEWLRSRRPRGFLLSTKGAHPHPATREVSRLSPEDISQDLQQSLERLQLDCIDLYWMHRDDAEIPVLEIIEALNTHLRAGRIGAIGASNWSVARIVEANEAAACSGLTGFCASQIGWSLAHFNPGARAADGTVHMDDEALRWHRQSGFPVMAYSAQANGFFATPLPDKNCEMTPKQKRLAPLYLNDLSRIRYERAHALAAQLGRSANEVAIAYVWSHGLHSVALIGPRTVEQLRPGLRATALRLSPEQIAFLEA